MDLTAFNSFSSLRDACFALSQYPWENTARRQEVFSTAIDQINTCFIIGMITEEERDRLLYLFHS